MRHLFECWSEVVGRLKAAERIALFLDFDGTLTPVRAHPEEAQLNSHVRRALAVLALSPRFRVSVISGRKRSDICARIRVPCVHYLGLHGWDRGDAMLSEKSRSLLDCVKSMLGGALVNNPRVWLEDKDEIIAVHFRERFPRTPDRARSEILRRVIQNFDDHLRLAGGKNIWEIVPREIEDKGAAVRKELASACCHATPVYAGDDLSDEPAFAALRHGVTVYVGRIRPAKARFRLAGAGEVRLFLEKLRADFT